MTLIRLITTFAFCCLTVSPVWAEPNLHDGKWEITSQMEIPGLPFTPPPVKFSQCLNKKDVVPQQNDARHNCRMVSTDIQGDTVFWVVECQDKGETVRSNGNITYQKDSFTGTVNVTTTGKNSGTFTSKMSGKRIGPCQ